MEITLFWVAFAAYSLATGLFLTYAWTRLEALASSARFILVAGAFFHLISLAVRTVNGWNMSGGTWYVPWTNWFESFSFFALVIVLEFFFIEFRRSVLILGAFITPLAFLSMIISTQSPFGAQIKSVSPALKSPWMVFHIPVMFVAYAAFANAFGIGLAYLLEERQMKSKKPSAVAFRLPPLDVLDQMIFRVIRWAFGFLTLGLFLGTQWAYEAWGRYWAWDPKETWALLSWLVYFIYLFMRVIAGWRGHKTAYLSMAGFLIVIITYTAVNHWSNTHGFLQ